MHKVLRRTLCLAAAASLLATVAPARAAAQIPPPQPDDGTRTNVYAFGGAPFLGGNDQTLQRPVVGMARTPSAIGYWLAASDGGVFAFGDAGFFGSTGGIALHRPIVGVAATPSGRGYWLVASDGGVFAFGDAGFFGSTGGIPLNRPIVGVAATPSGRGYWLVASDGGVFAFGDAGFFGSTGGLALNRPVVGLAAAPGGAGYWIVGSDGGIFAFGAAPFHGSTGALRLARPIVSITATSTGAGYWLAASDGGVFAFGNAPFHGSIPGARYASTEVVALAAAAADAGYWMASAQPAASARFAFAARGIDAALATRMQHSWRPGCPVALDALRYLSVRHWGFDGRPHMGELAVHADAVGAIESVMAALWSARFPIERMELVDNFGANDDASMAANNTSAFNCRFVAGTSRWSEHAYGRAIDINTVQNPFVAGTRVSPANAAQYANRALNAPGMIHAGGAVVHAFAAVGWGWGGNFGTARDYQHFSASGR
jgi:hypothetical protein